MSNGKWLNNIGRIIKKKDKEDGTPGGYFMVFERRKDKDGNYIGDNCFPLTVNEGDFFQLKPKKDDLQGLVDAGKLKQEVADEICKTVRFEISRAPEKDSAPAKDKSASKKADKDEVNF